MTVVFCTMTIRIDTTERARSGGLLAVTSSDYEGSLGCAGVQRYVTIEYLAPAILTTKMHMKSIYVNWTLPPTLETSDP